MDKEFFARIGELEKADTWSDEELRDMIKGVGCIISYLKNRGGESSLLFCLKLEQERYEGYLARRNRGLKL